VVGRREFRGANILRAKEEKEILGGGCPRGRKGINKGTERDVNPTEGEDGGGAAKEGKKHGLMMKARTKRLSQVVKKKKKKTTAKGRHKSRKGWRGTGKVGGGVRWIAS